jgi:hypothetical protein
MWFYYPCPACGRPISLFDNEPNSETDVEPKLQAAVKEHYIAMHGIDKLLLTDDELFYEMRNNKKSSETEPTY